MTTLVSNIAELVTESDRYPTRAHGYAFACDAGVITWVGPESEARPESLPLAKDSVGAFIQITMCGSGFGGHELGGHDLGGLEFGGHKVRGELTAGLTGVNRDWLIIDDCQLVNLSTVVALGGLRRCVGPNNQPTRQSTVQAWLRDRIGLKIAVRDCAARHSNSALAVGVLCQVGGDYIGIHHGNAAELVPLESLSRLVII